MTNISKNLPSVPIHFYLYVCAIVGFTGDPTICTGSSGCPSGTTGGTITSPGYSSDYTSMAPFLCIYRLTASTGHTIKMTLASGANIQTGTLIGSDGSELGPGLSVSKYTTRNNILDRKDKLMH